jgi:hypothetical protein
MIRLDGSGLEPLADVTGNAVNYIMFEPGGDRLIATTSVKDTNFGSFLADPPWPFTIDTSERLGPIELPGGILQPSTWSLDARLIAGSVRGSAARPSGVGVYDVVSGKSWQITSDADIWGVSWLPGRRVVYFTMEGELVVIDADTGDRRVIPVELPLPPAHEAFAVAPDGTALYYGAERVQSNIWIVEQDR